MEVFFRNTRFPTVLYYCEQISAYLHQESHIGLSIYHIHTVPKIWQIFVSKEEEVPCKENFRVILGK